MNIWETLDKLRTAEVCMLPLSDVKTDTCLQPRNSRLVPYKDKGRVEHRSSDHSTMLGLVLDCAQDAQLEPIWVADIPCSLKPDRAGGLYVVDGHHRLTAYKTAKREAIPARVLPMDFATAVLLSKPVNCTGRALDMHREQRLEAVWQYLAAATERGAKSLPDGESVRVIGRAFGVGHSSVARMQAQLRRVNLDDYPVKTCDPGTGWPHWRYVRQPKSIWQTPSELLPDMERVEREAGRLARIIVDLMDKSSYEARARALEILANEEIEVSDPVDAVNFLADVVRPHGTHVEYVLSHWDSRTPV